ncbi:MAG TPA: S8 family serine peptidase [Chthoniobacterales bacterium]|nr:S8 family serine peptidase [Chthoniobacterales bacterium]
MTRTVRNLALVLTMLAATSAMADPIMLRAGNFNPPQIVLPLPQNLQATQTSEPAYYIVQFKSAIQESDKAELQRRGLESVGYLPENAYILRLDGALKEDLANWNRVAWIGRFEPGYKLSPDFGKRSYPSEDRRHMASVGVLQFGVTLHDGADPDDAVRAARNAGLEVIEASKMGPRWGILAQGKLAAAELLAHAETVAFIEEAADATLRNDVTVWVAQTNQSGNTSIWNRGLHGENMILGHSDGAPNINHDMFRDPVNNTPGPNHRKVVFYSGSLGSNSHGTHTAGTLCGDQQPLTGSTFRNGHAYKARFAFSPIPSTVGLYTMLTDHYNVGARAHTNSWGDDDTTAYTQWCQSIDQYSWDREDATVVFAATNLSALKTPENAKNVLAVGNTRQQPNQDTPSTGGIGPTFDGRRKPEIWAPGTGILSASSTNTSGYTSSTGTSMACPAITGYCALVRQYYVEGRNNALSGRNGLAGRMNPSGALVRATIMNGGVDMTGMAGYPGPREGWGRLLLENSLWFAGDARRLVAFDLRNSSGLTTGGTKEYLVRVASSSEQLKITMTFTDWPAAVNASAANVRVNDMDLEVLTPGGTLYRGNVIDTSQGLSTPGGSPDTINTTEMVILNTPEIGVWTIRFRATAVNMGARQGAAVVATGDVRPF